MEAYAPWNFFLGGSFFEEQIMHESYELDHYLLISAVLRLMRIGRALRCPSYDAAIFMLVFIATKVRR
jgi:hypothetical protein